LKNGDLLSIDFGTLLDGYHGDVAITIPIGRVSRKADRIYRITESALYKGIYQAKPGNYISDISRAIENYVKRKGFHVVKDFRGHGVGKYLHEKPPVNNFTGLWRGLKIKPGMVIAIEPMSCEKSSDVLTLKDGWTTVTKRGGLAAHFEHTILITEEGPEILTKLLDN